MLEILAYFLLEWFWLIGWTFPVWIGEKLIYYGSFGHVVCEDEIIAGIVGIVFLLLVCALIGYFVFR